MSARLLSLLFVILSISGYAQIPQQKIQGRVTDAISGQPIENADIRIEGSVHHSVCDSTGLFLLNDIPVGTYTLLVTAMGYEPFTLRELELTSAKQMNLQISLKEKINLLAEVSVRPGHTTASTKHSNAAVSSQTLRVEEAARYAGGFDDPARLVASFAGIASNVGNNGISVRGNNPQSLQWRLEGIEIPNPSHFADNATFGGGVLSALSSHSLGNSEFLSGALPATYSNALSGVFDMYLRTGTTGSKERTIQAGLTGLDYAEEGPFKKNGKASYLFNYRYSTLALLKPLLPEDGGKGVKYQDLSFHLNFPTAGAGTFSVWGLGLKDFTGLNAKTDTDKWETITDRQDQSIRMDMGAMGLKHLIYLNRNTYLNTSMTATTNSFYTDIDLLEKTGIMSAQSTVSNRNTNLTFSAMLNSKLNARHSFKVGLNARQMLYDLNLTEKTVIIVKEAGNSMLLTAYGNYSHRFSDKLDAQLGLTTLYFTLNQHSSLEPRFAIKLELSPRQTISFGYGLHSRMERLNYYFAENRQSGIIQPNRNLNFTKAHHFVLAYNLILSEHLHFRAETYYQYLFNVPVVSGTSFSFLNLNNDWFFNQALENTGLGRNYGIDLSLNRYLSRGYYYSATASLFHSEYRGGDGIWRNTRYDRGYLMNALAGKEWKLGGSGARTLGVNIRLSYQGGDRYAPIDQQKSQQQQTPVFDESRAFEKQLPAAFITHFTLLYRVNRKRTTKEFALKILNAGRYKEFYDFQFNYKTQEVQEHREAIIIPNLSFKISF